MRQTVCHISDVSLFGCDLRPGQPIYDQVVYAAKKAIVSGEFAPGQSFPSVRALAADLKIHPNTAHKVVQHLIEERFLIARPGLGTVVADLPCPRAVDRKRLLREQVEQLVVEAKRLGIERPELFDAIEEQWEALHHHREVTRK